LFLSGWFGIVRDVAFEPKEDLAFGALGGFLEFCDFAVEIDRFHVLNLDFGGSGLFGGLRVLGGI
jgi:hypothetical protein